jgi:hypothetical protein
LCDFFSWLCHVLLHVFTIMIILFKRHRFIFWKESFLYTLKGIVSRIDVIFDWSEKRRFFDFCKSQIFRKFTETWIDKIRMYNKDGTRLQNKGVTLIVCLIFWTLKWLKWFMYDTLTVYSVTDFVQKIGQTLSKLFWVTMMIEMFRELLRKVLHTFCFHINQFEMHVIWT